MAYSTAVLTLHSRTLGNVGMQEWILDTTDATGDVDAAGYITDASEYGMEKGDRVFVRRWSAIPSGQSEKEGTAATAPTVSDVSWKMVMGISADGSADLSDETAIVVTNTD